MKLLTLFSAVLLLSSTAVNTTLAFQQVAYAETESLSEGTQQSSGRKPIILLINRKRKSQPSKAARNKQPHRKPPMIQRPLAKK